MIFWFLGAKNVDIKNNNIVKQSNVAIHFSNEAWKGNFGNGRIIGMVI